MAWYGSVTVRYRGRLVNVSLRYGSYNGARVAKGKPLDFNPEAEEYRITKLLKRVERRDPSPFMAPSDD